MTGILTDFTVYQGDRLSFELCGPQNLGESVTYVLKIGENAMSSLALTHPPFPPHPPCLDVNHIRVVERAHHVHDAIHRLDVERGRRGDPI